MLLAVPAVSMAADMPNIWPSGFRADMPDIWPLGFWAPSGLVSCTGAGPVGGTDQRNCRNLNDLIQTFLNVIAFGMTLALFVAAPILLAWGGLMILISGGSPDKIGSGKKILTGTVVGIVIVLASYLIVKLFVGALGIVGIGGFG